MSDYLRTHFILPFINVTIYYKSCLYVPLGKQFRAVVMTAVQTRDSLKTSHLPGLELFNDARVLNTAMTRAQSQVVVVGDAAALCCFGKCSKIWKTYIDHCISNNSAAPQHFTKDFFEKDVVETGRFQKYEPVDQSNIFTDAILQELRDEYEQQRTEDRSDDESLGTERFDQSTSRSSNNITDDDNNSESSDKKTEMYKRGMLVRETYNRGFVIPFNNPTKHISIKGRENLGKTFTGDEVLLQTAKVIRIIKEAQAARVLLCLLEEEDHSKPRQSSEDNFVRRLMMPIKKSEPKIRILLHKKRRNFIPVWEDIDRQWTIVEHKRLNENLRQNNVFMVQVIGWRENCSYPLGRVIDILPIGGSLGDGLRILNEEFKVSGNTSKSDKTDKAEEDERHREDIREVITFTVDPVGAKDLDDAISVRDNGNHFEVGVHIADVASYVSLGSDLDEDAKSQGATYYRSKGKPYHMFHQDLSTGCFSLLPGKDRRVVSLMFNVDKKTNAVTGEPNFQLSLIRSDVQFSYEKAEEAINKNYGQRLNSDTVEDCVVVAYCFAKAQRKVRLKGWAYSQPDGQRLPGERKAHLMIEELSVLFNKHASQTLIDTQKTRYCTPLRCQDKPNPEKVEEFKRKYSEFIPLSFQVRHQVDHVIEEDPNCKNFRILTQVWRDIQSAARDDDIDKMVDLVAADDIHPLLQPVVNQFRRCSTKAYVIRSKSSPKAEIGHYSLNVPSYTYATSPIRRYMDIVLQRLLHTVICDTSVKYTREEITTLCNQFEGILKNAKEYEQKAEQMSYAESMTKQSASKLAFVASADPDKVSFEVSFPFNKEIFAECISIMYNDLQLEDQPFYDKENHCIHLQWKKRIYAADTMEIHKELKMLPDSRPCIELPLKEWKAIIQAIDKQNWDSAKSQIIRATTKPQECNLLPKPSEMLHSKINTCSSEEITKIQSEHEVDISLQLQAGDTLQVQLTAEVKRAYQTPAVQLVYINPNFEICVDHVHSPIKCFSKSADDPSRIQYSDTKEYIRIWKPMCEMESASTAVDQSDSIIIEKLVVNFSKQEGTLTGSFFLPQEWIDERAIECNLSKCLLCVRKRGLKLTSIPEHCAVVDPREFTWVVHGVTRNVTKKRPPNEGSVVEFYVNHEPMEKIPECVFQKNTHFTVEIIPKLLPDM